MPKQIIISNNCNIPRTEFINIYSGKVILTKNEGMQEWISSGESSDSWHRRTSKVIITDVDDDSNELDYLRDPLVDESLNPPEKVGNKYHCIEPSTESTLHQSLLLTGEVSVTLSQFLPYVKERTI